MDAFDIYIEYAPDKGEISNFYIADYIAIYIFYAAYSFMYKYKKLVNVVRTTVSRTKTFVTDTYNTLEKAQIEKYQMCLKKGIKILNRCGCILYTMLA